MIRVGFVQLLQDSLLTPMAKVVLNSDRKQAAFQSHGAREVYRSPSAVVAG
jgi:hypothetical protein